MHRPLRRRVDLSTYLALADWVKSYGRHCGCRGGSRGGGGGCGVATPPKHSHCTASPRAHARMYVRTYVDIDLVDVTRTRNY